MNDGNKRSKLIALGGFAAVLIIVAAIILIAEAVTTETTPLRRSRLQHRIVDLDGHVEEAEIEATDGDPPKELECVDIVEGDGATAKAGDQVTVQYVGVDFDTGKQFDASWDNGQPFPFQLGSGSVIPGWDEGVEGMKVGGRRELIIPPDLAYGEQGQPPTIKPNATLVFVVDLLDVQPAATDPTGAAPPPTGG